MTFTQLEYVVAVDAYRHFAKAAVHCHVTQPTLSMQIQKLEEELDTKIFDRSKQPVIPTEMGISIIEQAKKIIAEKHLMDEMLQYKKGQFVGELKIGIIPTLAPYLLPLFVHQFTTKYPGLKLIVSELTTDIIIARLRENSIDAGILVTPLQENGITEDVLFYEELMAYVSKKNEAYKKTFVLAKDIDPEKLWLLEEGHCFRSQIVNLCELRRSSKEARHFEYEAGSFETLRRMVDVNDGVTILPELATNDFTSSQHQRIRHFRHPAPVREVSIVLHRNYAKKRLIEILKTTILESLPEKIKKNRKSFVLPV